MPKGIPRNGINTGRFKKTTIDICCSCVMCHKSFYIIACRKKALYCSNECYINARRKGLYKKRFALECKFCHKQYRVNKARIHTSLYCSRQCHNSSITPRGEKSHWWRGGIWNTTVNATIRLTKEYKIWRESVFKRDNYTCVICGDDRGGNLEADHIKPLSVIIRLYNISSVIDALKCNEIWDINNGRTLCAICHKKTDTYGRKSLYTCGQAQRIVRTVMV